MSLIPYDTLFKKVRRKIEKKIKISQKNATICRQATRGIMFIVKNIGQITIQYQKTLFCWDGGVTSDAYIKLQCLTAEIKRILFLFALSLFCYLVG